MCPVFPTPGSAPDQHALVGFLIYAFITDQDTQLILHMTPCDRAMTNSLLIFRSSRGHGSISGQDSHRQYADPSFSLPFRLSHNVMYGHTLKIVTEA